MTSAIVPMPERSTPNGRVAGEVRAEMARANISGNQLAKLIGRSQPYWSRRITGKLAFDVEDLFALAEILGVHPAKFLGADGLGTVPPGASSSMAELRTFNPKFADVIPLAERRRRDRQIATPNSPARVIPFRRRLVDPLTGPLVAA